MESGQILKRLSNNNMEDREHRGGSWWLWSWSLSYRQERKSVEQANAEYHFMSLAAKRNYALSAEKGDGFNVNPHQEELI